MLRVLAFNFHIIRTVCLLSATIPVLNRRQRLPVRIPIDSKILILTNKSFYRADATVYPEQDLDMSSHKDTGINRIQLVFFWYSHLGLSRSVIDTSTMAHSEQWKQLSDKWEICPSISSFKSNLKVHIFKCCICLKFMQHSSFTVGLIGSNWSYK